MSAPDLDDDERRPAPETCRRRCVECDREWYGTRAANTCPDCASAGGPPGCCFGCGARMRWRQDEEARTYAVCLGCDTIYPLATVRTYRLGQLVERIVAESRTGSPEEVGRIILAQGRASMRRVS